MDQLHQQEFTSLLADAPLNVVGAHFRSCARLTVRVWLSIRLNTLSFLLSFTHFLTIIHICFGIPHPMVPCLSWCHINDDLVIHLLRAHVRVNALQPMICFDIPLQPLHWKVKLMYKERFPAFSHAIHEDEWILSSLKMVFKHWWMLSFVITNLTSTNLV